MISSTNMNELITAMVGRSLESRFPPVDNTPGDPILSIQNLSTKYAPYLKDITFDVREGEIFGLYGLVGAGRTELLETIFGVRTRAAGRVYFKNHLMNFSDAQEAINHGFAMITEERKANGLFLKCDLTFNTTIANLGQYKCSTASSMSRRNKRSTKKTNNLSPLLYNEKASRFGRFAQAGSLFCFVEMLLPAGCFCLKASVFAAVSRPPIFCFHIDFALKSFYNKKAQVFRIHLPP